MADEKKSTSGAGAAAGGVLGAAAGAAVGGIGIAAMGTAIGISAPFVAAGAAVIGALAGDKAEGAAKSDDDSKR